MLPKNEISLQKLKGKIRIALLFEQGTTRHSKHLIFRALTQEKEKDFFCGVAVPKRLIKKAVNRNRIKRQMRAALENQRLAVSGFGLFIFKGKKTILTSVLTEEMSTLLEDWNKKK